jgi:hypothetical protein
MPKSCIYLLPALVVLCLFLRVSVTRRRRKEEEERRRQREREWQGTVFDASAVSPRIQRLRQDYLTAVQAQPHEAFYRKWLLTVARGMVRHLPYFGDATRRAGREDVKRDV